MELIIVIEALEKIKTVISQQIERETDFEERLKLLDAVNKLDQVSSFLDQGNVSLAKNMTDELASVLLEYLGIEVIEWFLGF